MATKPDPFADRTEAGRYLASALRAYADRTDVVVLALPRGGVPVAFEVARELGAPLDVFVVRKLGVPDHEELAMGAIASGGVAVFSRDLVENLGISREEIRRVVVDETRELQRREASYRQGHPRADVCGKIAILVDDGIATGATMRAAVTALRQHAPAKIVVAVPISSPDVCAMMTEAADEVVCVRQAQPLGAVGYWYRDFAQTSDEQVHELLAQAARLADAEALPAH